jgi:hypothetical protein
MKKFRVLGHVTSLCNNPMRVNPRPLLQVMDLKLRRNKKVIAILLKGEEPKGLAFPGPQLSYCAPFGPSAPSRFLSVSADPTFSARLPGPGVPNEKRLNNVSMASDVASQGGGAGPGRDRHRRARSAGRTPESSLTRGGPDARPAHRTRVVRRGRKRHRAVQEGESPSGRVSGSGQLEQLRVGSGTWSCFTGRMRPSKSQQGATQLWSQSIA